MNILYVMCGIPGSGKSTLSKKIASENDAVRFSLDEMGYVRQHKLIPHIVEALKNGESVVADSLYIKAQWRAELLEAVKDMDIKRVLLYMDVPLDVCIQRNRGREYPLHDFVVEHQFERFEPPALEEGWDEIIYVKEDGSYEKHLESHTQHD